MEAPAAKVQYSTGARTLRAVGNLDSLGLCVNKWSRLGIGASC